jgi:RNA polymerase sigma-70 factor (ECF subfamily)
MLKVRDNHAEAFEELVRRYETRLLTILFHWIGDRQRAEDLAQEVFLRVFRSRQRYQPGAKFSTWLFTIANNVASNAKRTLARRREVQVMTSPSSSTPGLEQLALARSGLMPSRVLDRSETSAAVHTAIQSLNERQRLALLLSKFEGMSYEEIGAALELSVPAVKSLLSRARENLRAQLVAYVAPDTEQVSS